MELIEEEGAESSRVNFVSCVKWVQKGVANPRPLKLQLEKCELVKIINQTKESLSDQKSSQNNVTKASTSGTDEFNFENYDLEDDTSTAALLGIGSLAELPTETEDNFSDSDDSEKEDDIIKPTDSLILAGHIEGDASVLEVYVYNEEEESLYVHHDILLPSYPLCLEWLNLENESPCGSYCAIGSTTPIIEVWDLDIVNCIEPALKLGKKKKKNQPRVGHSDAVLSLAWNKTYSQCLASGSVDKSIILWDMDYKEPKVKIKSFQDKVQCLEWHKFEATTLLAGSCDKTAKVFDARFPDTHQTWSLDGEAEKMCWHPLQPYMFLAGTNTGKVQCFDCRKGLLWSVDAHSEEISGLTVSPRCPGLLVTTSTDSLLKVWDLPENDAPKLIYEKDFNMGMLHSVGICPDLPFVVSLGGDKKSNNFVVYDLQNIDVVRNHFESKELVQLVTEATSELKMEDTSEAKIGE